MEDIRRRQETHLRLQKINRSHCSMQGETVPPDCTVRFNTYLCKEAVR